MKRIQYLCFAVNSQSRIIEKIYSNRKCCEKYADRRDCEMSMYFISSDSNKYTKALMLLEGEVFPNEFEW